MPRISARRLCLDQSGSTVLYRGPFSVLAGLRHMAVLRTLASGFKVCRFEDLKCRKKVNYELVSGRQESGHGCCLYVWRQFRDIKPIRSCVIRARVLLDEFWYQESSGEEAVRVSVLVSHPVGYPVARYAVLARVGTGGPAAVRDCT